MSVRAPNSLIDTYDVIRILVVRVNERNQNFFLGVSKRAKIMILAYHGVFVEVLAKFGLVACRMIQLLYFVVRPLAIAVRLRARDVTVITEVGSSSILLVVKAQASFAFMSIYIDRFVPFLVHLLVLKVSMSKRKNSPC